MIRLALLFMCIFSLTAHADSSFSGVPPNQTLNQVALASSTLSVLSTPSTTDVFISATNVGKTRTIPGCVVNLNGFIYSAQDGAGTAGTYPITISPASGTIGPQGSASYTLPMVAGTAAIFQCNGTNASWNEISEFALGTSVRYASGTSLNVIATDNGNTIAQCNANPVAAIIPDPGTLGFLAGGFQTIVQNYSPTIGAVNCPNGFGGTITLSRTTTATINGGTSITIPAGTSELLIADSAGNWNAITWGSGTGSGTSSTCVGVAVTPASGLQNAINANPPGTVFCLVAGTYTESQSVGNCGPQAGFTCAFLMKPGNQIIGAGMGQTIFDGQYIVYEGAVLDNISTFGRTVPLTYVQGITFTHYKRGGLTVHCNTASPITVNLSEFAFNGDAAGLASGGANGVGFCNQNVPTVPTIISNSKAHNNYFIGIAFQGTINLGATQYAGNYTAINNDVWDNNTSNTNPNGGGSTNIYCDGANISIINNNVHNITGGGAGGIYCDIGSTSWEVSGNWVHDLGATAAFGGQSAIAMEISYPFWNVTTIPMFRIHDNVVENNTGPGIFLNNSGNVAIYSNLIANNGWGTNANTHWGQIVLFDEGYRSDAPWCVAIGCAAVNIQVYDNVIGVPDNNEFATHNDSGGGTGTTFPTSTAAAATITQASPAVVTWTGSNLPVNSLIRFGSSGGGVIAGTNYYVIATGLTANTFEFSLTQGGAAVNTSAGLVSPQVVQTGSPITADWVHLNNTYGVEGDNPAIAVPAPNTWFLTSPSAVVFLSNNGDTANLTFAQWQALGAGGGYASALDNLITSTAGVVPPGLNRRAGFVCLPAMGVCP